MNAYCAFAFEAVNETLGVDALFLELAPEAIVFMDRSDGCKYRLCAGATGAFAEALASDGSGLGMLCPQSKAMGSKLSAPYAKRVAALAKAQELIRKRKEREAAKPAA